MERESWWLSRMNRAFKCDAISTGHILSRLNQLNRLNWPNPLPLCRKLQHAAFFLAKVACSCLAPGCRCGSLRTRWNRLSCRIMSWGCEGGEAWGNYMKLSDIFTTFSQHFPSSPCCSSCFQKIIENLRAASGWSDQLCWRGLPSWGLWWPASFIDNDGPRAYWFGWPLHHADDQHKLLKKYMTRSCISPCW